MAVHACGGHFVVRGCLAPSQYKDGLFRCVIPMIRPSYLYDGNRYIGKMNVFITAPRVRFLCIVSDHVHKLLTNGTRHMFCLLSLHDDVIKWKHFPRYWPFVRGIHRSPVNSSHKGQWGGALMFSLICACIDGWVNNRKVGDVRHHRIHYDVIVLILNFARIYREGLDQIWAYDDFLFIAALRTKLSGISIQIRNVLLQKILLKICLKMSFAKCRSFCSGSVYQHLVDISPIYDDLAPVPLNIELTNSIEFKICWKFLSP